MVLVKLASGVVSGFGPPMQVRHWQTDASPGKKDGSVKLTQGKAKKRANLLSTKVGQSLLSGEEVARLQIAEKEQEIAATSCSNGTFTDREGKRKSTMAVALQQTA